MTRHFDVTPARRFFRVEELNQPAWFAGNWVGQLYQTDGNSGPVALALDPSIRTYTSSYSGIPCAGPLSVVSIGDTEIVLREETTQNPGDCSWDGTIVVRKLADNRLVLLWFDAAIPGASVAILDKEE